MPRIYQIISFSDTLDFADSLGFDSDAEEDAMRKHNGDQYTPDVADALEEAAIAFIESQGYDVKHPE